MVKRPRLWQGFIQRIASLRPAAWFFSLILHHLDSLCIRLSKGRTSLTSLLTGLPVVRLTTIGAKSGKPWSVPLLGIPHGENVVLVASNWGQRRHPAWYYNLRAHPEARLLIKGQMQTYLAREATGPEYDACWRRAVETYAGYAAYKLRTGGRVIPIMVLSPREG